MKKIFNWFRRDDLNLKNRWWHRLLHVVFIVLFCIFIIFQLSSINKIVLGIPQWEKTALLDERINSELKSVNSLLEAREVLEGLSYNNSRILNIETERKGFNKFELNGVSMNDIYCSNQIENYINKIMLDRNIEHLYLTSPKLLNEKVSFEAFKNNVIENKIKCLVLDSYTKYDKNQNVIDQTYFLRTDKSLFFENINKSNAFYKVSESKTILAYLVNFLAILAYSFVFFYVISVIYYKVIIFIIFGNKK